MTNNATAEGPASTIPVLEFLQARAKKLGAWIAVKEDELQEGLDYGPFMLCYSTGELIWAHGLPLESIAEALDCFERELRLPPGQNRYTAWADFCSEKRRP